MTLGSLFSGIGGIDLGFERAGFTVSWQVEIDDYCRRVLAKHWPDVRRHDDVRTFPPGDANEWRVDCIAGGFPCQDISAANPKGAGIGASRSGLWSEFARIIDVVRPRFVVVENVAALLWPNREERMGRVLGDLARLGFDADWGVLPACSFGAPHTRERVFIVAYAQRPLGGPGGPDDCGMDYGRVCLRPYERPKAESSGRTGDGGKAVRGWWETEPRVGRVADGIPRRLDRLRGLGNAVVPQVAEWIARRIKEAA